MDILKKPIYKKWWVWVIAVIIVFGIAGSASSNKDKGKDAVSEKQESTASTDKKDDKKKEDSKVNYDNFMKIAMGSTYTDVVNLLGEGTESTSSEVGGIKTVMYTWKGSGVSNMNITIQNGAVTGKTQLGLSKPTGDITLEKYNKIENGMSLQQVEAILGNGALTSQSKIMDIESSIYSWANKDGSNCNVTLQGDSVQMKAQLSLK